jgi:hypothetical protein
MRAISRKEKEQKLLADKAALPGGKESPNRRAPVSVSGYMLEIHLRAQAMTPILKEILDFRPSPHWNR